MTQPVVQLDLPLCIGSGASQELVVQRAAGKRSVCHAPGLAGREIQGFSFPNRIRLELVQPRIQMPDRRVSELLSLGGESGGGRAAEAALSPTVSRTSARLRQEGLHRRQDSQSNVQWLCHKCLKRERGHSGTGQNL